MDAFTKHSLVKAATVAGFQVLEKSASATPQQLEVLDTAWPDAEREELTKLGALSRILATGLMVEEAEQAEQQAALAAQTG